MSDTNQTKKMQSVLSKRVLWQEFQRLVKLREFVFDARFAARKEKHFEYVQSLAEMSEELGRTMVHMRQLCKKLYNCKLEDLETFK